MDELSDREHVFFFSSRRRHTRSYGDWSSDVCSSDLADHEYRAREVEVRQEEVLQEIARDSPLREIHVTQDAEGDQFERRAGGRDQERHAQRAHVDSLDLAAPEQLPAGNGEREQEQEGRQAEASEQSVADLGP